MVGGLRRIGRRGKHVASRAVHGVGQGQRDRLARERFPEVAVGGDDALDRVTRPDGRIRTSAPAATLPAAICPANPRKSWFGRLTHWTGIRNGLAASAAASSGTESR